MRAFSGFNTNVMVVLELISVVYLFCSSRQKRVIELGSGYGLAGLVVAMTMEALEVFISDGNPQVVDCILLL